MKSAAEDIQETLGYYAKSMARYGHAMAIAEELKLKADGTTVLSEPTRLVLRYYSWADSDPAGRATAEAKAILPYVGRMNKSFDETTNEMSLTCTYKGVEIVFEFGTPETCTVQKVEETVEVPEKVIPAHTETKVKYVLSGDCNPLMAPKTEDEPTETETTVAEAETPAVQESLL